MSTDWTAIITYASGGVAVITGALELLLKIKAALVGSGTDWEVEIKNLDADARAQNAEVIARADAWAVAHGYPVSGE